MSGTSISPQVAPRREGDADTDLDEELGREVDFVNLCGDGQDDMSLDSFADNNWETKNISQQVHDSSLLVGMVG